MSFRFNKMSNKFITKIKPTWCLGCGNFGIHTALQSAFEELKLEPWQVLMVYGIGCFGNGSNFLKTNAFHGLHGRPLPVAMGAKLANPSLTVIASSGDGDAYSEGGNHLLEAIRANIDITLLVHNNGMFSLTTGQASPTTPIGQKTKSTPFGQYLNPLNPIALALSQNASFVARGLATDVKHLQGIIFKALSHKGFSLVDIIQPCVSFNKEYSAEFWAKHTVKIEKTPETLKEAMDLAMESKKLPIGLFWQEKKPTLADKLPDYPNSPLWQEVKKVNLEKILQNYH